MLLILLVFLVLAFLPFFLCFSLYLGMFVLWFMSLVFFRLCLERADLLIDTMKNKSGQIKSAEHQRGAPLPSWESTYYYS